jgi:muramidase (phage lysozyme)
MPVTYIKATSDGHLKIVMERISELLGKTVVVHSGDRDYVPPGGSRTSLHLAHRAVDLHVPGISDSSILTSITGNLDKIFDKSQGYELIRHGEYTATGGPHIHIGHYEGSHVGNVILKLEGLTPSTSDVYTPQTLPIGNGSPLKTSPTTPKSSETFFQSVGKDGINKTVDIKTIQGLLNLSQQRLITAGVNFERFKVLKEDGIIGNFTISAIKIFQRDVLGFNPPDGRVDAGGKTLRTLKAISTGDFSSIKTKINDIKVTPASGSATASSSNEALADDRRIKAFFDVLGFTEGTGNNYGKVVNGTVISAPYNPELVGQRNVSVTDLSRHPDILVRLNASLKSTAAGRYQFLSSTWGELGMPNFGARSQDIAAVKLMKRRKMIEPILAGNLRQAVTNGAPEWASLPTAGGGSFYGGQPARTFEEISAKYSESLKKY